MKKHLFFTICAILFASSIIAGEHAYDGTTFTISSSVALPVHVRFGGKEITISSYQYTTYTRISNAAITDAKGRNCIYRHTYDSHSGSNGSYVHHYYSITGVYSSSNSSSSSSSSTSSSYSSYSDDSRASQLGSAWAGAAQATKIYDYNDNYRAGGFSLAATVSALWGENLELRLRYGSSRFGGDITGMIGYDWIKNKKIAGIKYKPNWSAGIGMYFGGRPSYMYLWDVDLGVKFGKSSKPVNNSWTAVIDLSTTHLIGPEHVIGLIAGAGIGLAGNGKHPGFAWDVRGGIVIYFLQWNWL